ncbi:DNA-directed RNA polymerase I subunit RPA1 [Anopheles bellator]|uniref:DNA-directed RNA polymerase I subunit RPA1 n=1 Tax=Anopheles bellator TaxID=139047 RepID=UPI002648E043|nr:DNA-directed RNA polymerase I subunit RPA1 [Anopheles bellator]
MTIINLDPTNLEFSVFTTEDIRKISVAKISNPRSFNELGHALAGGLYDPAMGPSSRSEVCLTCARDEQKCEGHFGHIEIDLTVYNPFFLRTLYNMMRISCMSCTRLLMHDGVKAILELQLRLADAGYLVEAEELDVYKAKQQADPAQPIPEVLVHYEDLLHNQPYNMLGGTKLSGAIRTAIVNGTLKECVLKKCIHCKATVQKVRMSDKKLCISWSRTDKLAYLKGKGADKDLVESQVKASVEAMLAHDCMMYLRRLYALNGTTLQLLFPMMRKVSVEHPTDIFFMEVVPVPPPKVRPVKRTEGETIVEHPQSAILRDILLANSTVRAILMAYGSNTAAGMSETALATVKSVVGAAKGETQPEKLYYAWLALQTNVDRLLEEQQMSGKNKSWGLKLMIEKKFGIIRQHMMGKRVNHAARTVITPDPNIGVEEIGIPRRFALKLTYPVPVTPWNVAELRQWVLNGPDVYPGANMVEDSNGRVIKLSAINVTHRQSVAKTLLTPAAPGGSSDDSIKIVHRHLQNGDILLLNRQPTLHRPSIMAHRARILPGEKIFRLHYSNCKSYNADFDGDEMNAHLPQNEVARSEAYELVAVPYQYLVPKDGTPLGGLIQDHIVSAVKLFIRGKFFNREDYQQLVFQALSNQKGDIELLPPSIVKPVRLWSGKQIISTIVKNSIPKGLPHINLEGKSKLSNKHWRILPARPWQYGGSPLAENELSESEVFIRQGELLCGILDKNHFGATPYGLIHCMYELYGGVCSTTLLSSLSRLFTYYLQWEGFTLGVHDILVQAKADRKRAKIIAECRAVAGHEATAAALELPGNVSREELTNRLTEAYAKNPKFRSILDRKYKSVLDKYTNQINNACLPEGLISKFPENNLQLMVQSGAKGSTVNTMQISCLLGQIELEGKRPPLMMSGRSLPSFAHFETSPKSGGFIDGRFMTGIQPQDFFFHCMAGREGLIDTAVKTSRSGYLQRCLVKHLEGLSVQYDMTVRDSDGSVVQFMYGEDGLDIAKSQFVGQEKQVRFLDQNRDVIVRGELQDRLANAVSDDPLHDAIKKHVKQMKRWRKQHGAGVGQKTRHSGFSLYSEQNALAVREKLANPDKLKSNTGRTKLTQKLMKRWNKLDTTEKRPFVKQSSRCPDPLAAVFRADAHFGVLPERLEELVRNYKRTEKPIHDVDELMQIKGSGALVAPGEPVGVLAAQSIGEPSTQMTLNTFHFAGRGEMNVTLGIPRLREILMSATANIKTPSMEIPFLPHRKPERLPALADKLRKSLNRVTVADVLENIHVKSRLVLHPSRGMQHVIRFNFLPPDAYAHDYRVTPQEILRHMSRHFFTLMFKEIRKVESTKNVLIENEVGVSRKSKKAGDNEGDEEIDASEPTGAAEAVDRRTNTEADSDSESEDSDAAGDDADATESKIKGKKSDDHAYDDGESEQSGGDSDGSADEGSDGEGQPAPQQQEVIDEAVGDGDIIGPAAVAAGADQRVLLEAEEVKHARRANEQVKMYTYDRKQYRWCQLELHMPLKLRDTDFTKIFRQIAGKSVVWEVPRIKRAITYTQNDRLYLKTDGINISAMARHAKLLDLRRLYMNDVHAMAARYGIEAASRVIVKEIQNVFSVYGIVIDPRHLLLVADYMTSDGTFKGMSRAGMDNSASPLQQMSFESSLTFLKNAMLRGTNDRLESPSSRLMVGQPCKSGTGAFTLYSSALKDYSESR